MIRILKGETVRDALSRERKDPSSPLSLMDEGSFTEFSEIMGNLSDLFIAFPVPQLVVVRGLVDLALSQKTGPVDLIAKAEIRRVTAEVEGWDKENKND